MDRLEKRRDRRLGAKFDISCYTVGSAASRFGQGRTVNVSSGGLYFQTVADVFEPGNLLRVELSIPPTPGLLEFGGKIAGFARVLRADNIGGSVNERDSSLKRYGVALQFCRPLKLCI